MDTKKLRQKILDLAIRGKLVPQDPNDEPASVLLERIRTEKERLVKEGKIKRSKKMASDDEIEAPFEIPESWEWVRLCDITVLIEDCPHSTAKDEGHGYPLIRTPNVGEGYLIFDGVHRVSESVYNKRNARAIPETNDIIYAREAPAGNAAVIKENEIVCLGQRTVLIRPFKKYINSKLLAFFIISPHSRNSLISTAVGSTATHVNLENIRPFNIPIPPLSEQKRIVNAVERWFTLIDEMESNEGDLLRAIDKAKSKILDLAIHGKLVPQDPNDEPAIELLKRINPKFETIDMEECPFAIPQSWAITSFQSVCDTIPSKPFQILQSEINNTGKIPVISQSANYIEGYSDREDRIFMNDNAILIFGDHTRILKYVDFNFIVGADGVKIIRTSLFTRYVYYALLLLIQNIQDKGYARHFSILSKSHIPVPPHQEQLRIVAKIEELFAVLDSIKDSL